MGRWGLWAGEGVGGGNQCTRNVLELAKVGAGSRGASASIDVRVGLASQVRRCDATASARCDPAISATTMW